MKVLIPVSCLIVLFISGLVFKANDFSPRITVNTSKTHTHSYTSDQVSLQIERLSQAIQFATVSTIAPDEYDKDPFESFNKFIFSNYPNAHRVLNLDFSSGFTLLFSVKGRSESLPPVLLIAHSDVVSVQNGLGNFWEHPPFSGHVDETHIWGRGALDNKSAILAIFESIEKLASDKDWSPDRTIYLAITHDEEVGGHFGAKRVAEYLDSNQIRPYFILDEGQAVTQGVVPNIIAPVALIGVSQKGYMTVELSAKGKAGHSMMPPKATAISKLSNAITKLTESRMPPKMTGPIKGMFKELSYHADFPSNIVLYHTWLTEPLVNNALQREPSTDALVRTSMSVNVISGGIAENVLPSQATALINYRIAPHNSSAEILEHIRKTIDGTDTDFRVVSNVEEPAPITDHKGEAYQLIGQAIVDTFPNVVVAPSITLSTTDSRHFIDQTENILRFTPIFLTKEDLSRFHGMNERISIENYQQMIDFYTRLLITI